MNRGNAAKRVALVDKGPWKSWRRMSRHARAIRFMQTYCRPPKGKGHGQPIKLARFQKEFLEEALATNVDVAVLASPRGNGKSSFGGALATWSLFDDDETGSPQVPIIATTITQAVRSCYGVAVAMVKAEPELERRALIYTGIAQPRVVVPFLDGELFPVSNEPDGLQGLDPSMALVDEIGFQPQESWDSLRLAAGKRERSLTLGLGTPGLDRDNALYGLRERVRDAGGSLPGVVFREYAAPEGCAVDDRSAWTVANPAIKAGFLREAVLETDLAITPEAHFRIFRLGQWVDGTDAWLGADGRALWEGLTNPYELLPDQPTWVGVDVALKRDTTAVVTMQRRTDDEGEGRLHAVCRIWTPTAERPVDTTEVMQHLRDLDDAYQVEAISYDPRFFDVPAKFLLDEGLPMFEVPQSLERMTMAVGGLYEAIMARRITHDGDEAFAAQVLNATPRFNERGFTLAKDRSRGKIDAVIALALAHDRSQRHETVAEPEPWVIMGGRR